MSIIIAAVNSWFLLITSHKYCSVATVAVGAVVAVADFMTSGGPGHIALCLYILVRCLKTFLQEMQV